MSGKVRMLGLITICVLALVGCSNQSPNLAKENAQLKTEIGSLKEQAGTINNKAKQQDELYELRNALDNNLHNTLKALIKGDFNIAHQNIAPTMLIENKKLTLLRNDIGGLGFRYLLSSQESVPS